ncbi:NAD-dependent epimerase/dehydratase family protein [Planosporangium thailandense]|uniref:NAD-dependent epimerase/dehydratase family protein n=1 Tax=Planosporangium thailandense TaxID=765197 RepID=UPI001F0DA953|nr:NAD(P)-dependent oxidoreductase [Planosporangium thailandense]
METTSGQVAGNPVRRLLITGAAGNMGRLLRPLLRRDGRVLRLADVVELDHLVSGEERVVADVRDPVAVGTACQGVDAVLHLGGLSSDAPFDDILAVNVAGTHNVLRAAVDAGVSRVILASSNHAVGFYRRSTDLPPGAGELPDGLSPRPDTFYGWSKAAMESLGSLYHDRYGLDVIALRIGTCFAEPVGSRGLATWLAPTDAANLIEACLAAPRPGFRVVWAVSDNTRRWWSLEAARALGYVSTDDAERFAAARIAEFGEPDPADPVHDLVGGSFCSAPLGQPIR